MRYGWLVVVMLAMAACEQYNSDVSSNAVKTCAAACPGGVKSVRAWLCECYPPLVPFAPDAGVAKDTP